MHSLLEHQTKYFLRENLSFPSAWHTFLAEVDATYFSTDADRKRLEYALELKSTELVELRARLAELQFAEAQLEHLLLLFYTTLEPTADGIMLGGKEELLARFNQRFIEMCISGMRSSLSGSMTG